LAFDSILWSPFPQLETERLILREITPADSDALFEIYSDEEVMRYWSCKPFSSIDQANNLIANIKEALDLGNSIDWAITLRGSDRLIGKCRFSTWRREHCRAEISYILSRKYWGQGIAGEALCAILTYGFIHMELHSIEAQVTPGNTASTRMLERLGFVLEGHLRESFLVEDTFVDSLIYSLLRKDWEDLKCKTE
jgi:[ribosomal protein S5]-alanine N-acetyltransferase